ncbi:MAG: hypothetical protein COS89_03635 [Deltaproteobacteria bacterium CG07_land_8_20_14_0_80_38_7]|nr:MAG: hypothetical protein COS89_03635 [Deltaproteobacteria bacterium CG07_land_8_20_14_0_80_38_7]
MPLIKIHYEDSDIMVVEKPGGIPTLPARNGIKPTLYDLITKKYPEQLKINNEAGIVHRLDNETSGLVLIAKNPALYQELRKLFSEDSKKITKEYIALVIGHTKKDGEINTWIAHHPEKQNKMIVCSSQKQAEELKARKAFTEFHTTNIFTTKYDPPNFPFLGKYSLLTIKIATGIRHQIRAHLASIGHPIAGDKLYQNAKIRQKDILPHKRIFLHATKLTFKHPKTSKLIDISSPLPNDLIKILRLLVICN